MRIRLKGLNSVKARLSDGKTATYYYAWKGGPRLPGAPGSPEFIAAYNAAVADDRPRTGANKTISGLTDRYLDSADFSVLAVRTQTDYRKFVKAINSDLGDFPLIGLSEKTARAAFMDWRDGLAKKSRRQADYAWTVLARVLSWGLNRGLIDANPCTKGGRLYSGSRADKVWSSDDEAAMLAKASAPIALALHLALWTGQRQGDLLRLPWSAYDGSHIRLKQGKTGARVTIPVAAPLKAILAATKKHGPLILVNSAGAPWTPDGFRVSWAKTCKRAKITGLTFHDLRGTAVTRLFIAGCSVAEIATITGHSLRDVQNILDANYFHRDIALAESGIKKYELSIGKTRVTD